jgi:hypothetical protein
MNVRSAYLIMIFEFSEFTESIENRRCSTCNIDKSACFL